MHVFSLSEPRTHRSKVSLALSLLLLFGVSAAAAKDSVKTESGLVAGVRDAVGVTSYKGIPYAAAPVGSLRWKSPRPVPPWAGVRKADHFGPVCMQNDLKPGSFYQVEFYQKPQPVSEDCLYLNLWTAAKSVGERRPVMFWIHGGGFVEGSGSLPSFDGSALAKKGVVVVTINYRLGVFGFLAHPELTKESGYNASGNYGLLDQLAALKWVSRNIAAFGGDPQNVTIFGQSAGAASVVMLSVSPLAKGLFQRVIMQSGGFFGGATLTVAEEQGAEFAKSAGAASIAELRKIPAAHLLQKTTRPPDGKTNVSMFWPSIDGYFLIRPPKEVFEAAQQNCDSFLTGSTSDEGTTIFPTTITLEEYKKNVQTKLGTNAPEFLKLFPANTNQEAWRAQVDNLRDSMASASRFLVRLEAARGHKAFWYYFDRVPPGSDSEHYGAYHSSELVYVFDELNAVERPWQEWDRKLADIMSSYWVNFAATGDPNGQGLPPWPTYDARSDQSLELGNTIVPSHKPDRSRLEEMERNHIGFLM
jgi:para-nitrobenzyl esterase